METHKSLLIIGAALAIGGCGNSPPSASPSSAGASPRPAAAVGPAAAASCAMATQSANTCQVKTSMFGRKRLVCELIVGGSPDQPFVYPYVLDLSQSDKTIPIFLVWKLVDPGYKFVDKNSGPTQPGMSSAFTDGDTTDDDDGATANGGPARKYRWKYAHPGTAVTYKYDMRFQVPNLADPSQPPVTVTCDPTIKSSAD
ncbi:MAG: hypothetical protein K8R60_18115 [Burkholderiales bacterium]|nr:hypothetical protein [Burkholderiales bacterium]